MCYFLRILYFFIAIEISKYCVNYKNYLKTVLCIKLKLLKIVIHNVFFINHIGNRMFVFNPPRAIEPTWTQMIFIKNLWTYFHTERTVSRSLVKNPQNWHEFIIICSSRSWRKKKIAHEHIQSVCICYHSIMHKAAWILMRL